MDKPPERLHTIAAIIGASSFAAIIELSGNLDKLGGAQVTALGLLAWTIPVAAAFFFRPPKIEQTFSRFCSGVRGVLYVLMSVSFVSGFVLILFSFDRLVACW